MTRTVALAIAFLVASSAASATPALDKAGKCRDNGKFVAATMCKTPPAKCRDAKGKFAKCGTPGAVAAKK